MPRLKLKLEALAVESFATVAGNGRRGTVRGAAHDAFAGTGDTPVEDTGCTAPCLSGESGCKIISCGSTCEAGSCYACGTMEMA
ncbi:MAG TPA: pinensin family lanthipeptide [Longimicrobium sp.]|nr:pinensin family lanthipeptide [Longimicrobium sp.]